MKSEIERKIGRVKVLGTLNDVSQEIEKRIYQRLREKQLIDATVVFYDLTSSCFEGEDVPFTAHKARETRQEKIKKLETWIHETHEKHKEKKTKKEIQKIRDMILAKLGTKLRKILCLDNLIWVLIFKLG